MLSHHPEEIVNKYAEMFHGEPCEGGFTTEESKELLNELIDELFSSLQQKIEDKKIKEEKCNCCSGEGCGCKVDDYNQALKDILALFPKK